MTGGNLLDAVVITRGGWLSGSKQSSMLTWFHLGVLRALQAVEHESHSFLGSWPVLWPKLEHTDDHPSAIAYKF